MIDVRSDIVCEVVKQLKCFEEVRAAVKRSCIVRRISGRTRIFLAGQGSAWRYAKRRLEKQQQRKSKGSPSPKPKTKVPDAKSRVKIRQILYGSCSLRGDSELIRLYLILDSLRTIRFLR